jgi:UDP:flavonoid glycosyltransferase YjiC (YdhE family)
MRVLFTVSNWPGHYFPMVPLGWALQGAGHEVAVACAASEAGPISRAGLTPVALLQAPDMLLQARVNAYWNAQQGRWPYPTGPLHPLTGAELGSLDDFDCTDYILTEMPRTAVPLARRSSDSAVDFARQWRPDLIVHDPLSIEGPLAAKVTGVPSVLHLWGPAGTHEDEPGLFGAPPDFSRAFGRYGVGKMSFDRVDYVIDLCPEDLRPQVTAPRLPMRYIPYNGPGQMPDWVLDEPSAPRVCVVWGSSATRTYGRVTFVVPQVLEALAELDVEVVLTVNRADLDHLGALPANVRALEHVPLHLLLPTCSAVVHHGGAGCVMTAVWAGVPQLALPVPDGAEQCLNSRRVAAAGAGLEIPNHRAGADNIRAAVTRLLAGPGYRDAAGRLRRQASQQPTPAQVARTLEELTRPRWKLEPSAASWRDGRPGTGHQGRPVHERGITPA